jgi:von Hippel-Lindau disease tumor suppressor protein
LIFGVKIYNVSSNDELLGKELYMLDSIKGLSASVIVILLGAAMIIIGAANGLSIGGNSVQISNEWKVAIVIIGGGLLCFGGYLVWREPGSGKATKSSAKTETISHTLRSGLGNPEHRPHLHIANASKRTIAVYWIDGDGVEMKRGNDIRPGGPIHREYTYSTHPFLIKDASSGEQLFVAIPRNETDLTVTLSIEDTTEE